MEQATRHTLVETLETTMRLLHPFMPFITEEIWQTIPHQGDSIVVQHYPVSDQTWAAPDAEQHFSLLEQTVGLVRTGRALLNYPPGQQIPFHAGHDDPNGQNQLHQLQRTPGPSQPRHRRREPVAGLAGGKIAATRHGRPLGGYRGRRRRRSEESD